MKNMYAVKCLYSYKFYDINHNLIEDITPSWEERIILIKAISVEEVENKIDKYAKEYENSYINEDNQIVEIRLYEVIDIYALFDLMFVVMQRYNRSRILRFKSKF